MRRFLKQKILLNFFSGLVGGIFGFTVGHALLDFAYLGVPLLEMMLRAQLAPAVAPIAPAGFAAAANNILEPLFIAVQPAPNADQIPVENHM